MCSVTYCRASRLIGILCRSDEATSSFNNHSTCDVDKHRRWWLKTLNEIRPLMLSYQTDDKFLFFEKYWKDSNKAEEITNSKQRWDKDEFIWINGGFLVGMFTSSLHFMTALCCWTGKLAKGSPPVWWLWIIEITDYYKTSAKKKNTFSLAKDLGQSQAPGLKNKLREAYFWSQS